jgi:hypothetical protein
MTEQERLIGKHPEATHILGEWLTHVDQPTIPSKKHRKLEENNKLRQKAICRIANWIIEHHVIDHKREALRRKTEILKKHEFDEYVESLGLLPAIEKTKKGNVAEIILVEYLRETTRLSPIIHKLRYNTNIEQSMKGDDVLLLNPTNVLDKIIYGESKYRSTPSKQVIEETVSNLEGSKRLPVSIGFVVDRLYEMGDSALADELMDLQYLLKNIDVHNVGFLLSTKSTTPSQNTSTQVDRHLNTKNPNLVFISLGLDNPIEIVNESFRLAKEQLLNIKPNETT